MVVKQASAWRQQRSLLLGCTARDWQQGDQGHQGEWFVSVIIKETQTVEVTITKKGTMTNEIWSDTGNLSAGLIWLEEGKIAREWRSAAGKLYKETGTAIVPKGETEPGTECIFFWAQFSCC